MRFRSYHADDLEEMFALDEACFELPFRFSKTMMRRFAEAKKARVVIAEKSGLAGFCIVHVERVEEGRVGYVVTLDVAERWRRKGLATELMRRGEAEAREAGCWAMVLHVFVGNDAAIRFYDRCGYERREKAEGFYGEGRDAWVYRKALSEKTAGGGGWDAGPK